MIFDLLLMTVWLLAVWMIIWSILKLIAMVVWAVLRAIAWLMRAVAWHYDWP
jgi:hypothetical protein